MTWINLARAVRHEIEQKAARGPTPEQMELFPNLYNPKEIREREEKRAAKEGQ